MARNRHRLAAAVSVAALAGAGVGAGAIALTHDSAHSTPVTGVAPAASSVASAALTVGQIAKAATPGVVEIDAAQTSTSPFPGGGQGGSTAEGTGFVYD